MHRGLIFCWLWALAATAAGQGKPLDFNRDVKPILSNNCFHCHGPDESERKGGTNGLRLDTADGATADQGGQAAVVPGSPEKSELVKRILSTNPDEVMPPRETGKKLTAKEIETLREWIKQGGKYAVHWSYAKPVRPALPTVKNEAWVKNEIDRFILARLEKEGLSPTAAADRYALIRRVSLDLTGLPPTLAEVEEFVNDKDPQAYSKLVDRLLAKESYGEHWAHHWLDLARYADSAGYADDPPRKIWQFRDYVIRSLNANKPFDQFTIEQIAGDLLPNPTDEQLVATAFHRNTLTNNEGGTNDEEFRNVAVVDRVTTTFAVWMGTTMTCAQCHSHKYDPISQEDFFRVFAIFNSTEDADRGNESPLLSRFTEEQQQQKKSWEDELAAAEAKLKTATPDLKTAALPWEANFPRQLAWKSLQPTQVQSQAGLTAKIQDDQSILLDKTAETDSLTIEIPTTAATKLQALRLESLPHEALPGKGAGHGGGNFVITRISAAIQPVQGGSFPGRYVRIELPGSQKMLSLAEVQVFRGGENLALQGEASQSSTDYEGPAKLAIDGNTNGDYNVAKSTTHTATSDNPWWEVDLKSQQAIDRIVVWNRSDGNVGSRLAGYKISVLNEKKEVVWKEEKGALPSPSTEFSLTGQRAIEFATAFADFHQPQFEPDSLFDAKEAKKPVGKKAKGWAVGGGIDKPHQLTLVAKGASEIPAGSKLIVTIEQGSQFKNHTLGQFRLSFTDAPQAAEYAQTPAVVLAALQVPAAERTAEQQETVLQHFLTLSPALAPLRQQVVDLKKKIADVQPLTVPIMKEMAKPRVTKIQHRGNFLDLGKEVSPGVPAAWHPLAAEAPANRLELAKWLIDENNPLTARVIANRYWEQIFGIGIVATSEEFGNQGDLPVHAELLDWLATELVRQKWNTKALIKLLVTSAAYQQGSQVTPELYQRDPENRLLARGPRFRLSAEMVRDQALSVAGLLSKKMYGPPVNPPQPALGVSAAFGSGIDWQTSAGDDKFRRGLYTTWRRSNPYPSMVAFDAPNREVCTLRRSRTNTPLQALVTLNDPVYIEAAQALARRLVTEGGPTPTERSAYAFRLVLARPPHAEETNRLVALFEKSLARFQQQPEQAKKMAAEPLGSPPPAMSVPELAAWTVVCNVILNLDETLMKK